MDGLRAKVAQSRGHAVDLVELLSTLIVMVRKAGTFILYCYIFISDEYAITFTI